MKLLTTDKRTVENMYKVPFREVYADTWYRWLDSCFECFVGTVHERLTHSNAKAEKRMQPIWDLNARLQVIEKQLDIKVDEQRYKSLWL